MKIGLIVPTLRRLSASHIKDQNNGKFASRGNSAGQD